MISKCRQRLQKNAVMYAYPTIDKLFQKKERKI